MKQEPKERICNAPAAMGVVGSKLMGYAMDESDQMSAGRTECCLLNATDLCYLVLAV
jgi:hypothetical protein